MKASVVKVVRDSGGRPVFAVVVKHGEGIPDDQCEITYFGNEDGTGTPYLKVTGELNNHLSDDAIQAACNSVWALIIERGPQAFPARENAGEAQIAQVRHSVETPEDVIETPAPTDDKSKRDRILELYESGTKDIAEIVRRVKVRPSYVAQVLQQAGHLTDYFDLYTATGAERNVYTRFFRNVLRFSNVEAARESVARIDRLYNYFERLGDRAGQHQAMILALTGYNRARWSGKQEEAAEFRNWLVAK